MAQRVQRNLGWIFSPEMLSVAQNPDGATIHQPNELADSIVPVVDPIGTVPYKANTVSHTATAVATQVNGYQVPDDKVALLLAAEVSHATGATVFIWGSVTWVTNSGPNLQVSLGTADSFGNGGSIGYIPKLWLPSKCVVTGQALTAASLTIKTIVIELPAGAYCREG